MSTYIPGACSTDGQITDGGCRVLWWVELFLITRVQNFEILLALHVHAYH